MSANKFATMLHKNTNKLTSILIYAILEWVLILLLLLNSLFSYLILNFAYYFGLKPPCLLCSSFNKSHRDLICDKHANEISQLESRNMCESCCSSQEWSKEFALFLLKPSWQVLDYSKEPMFDSDIKVDDLSEEGDQFDQSGSDQTEHVERHNGESSACCSVCDYRNEDMGKLDVRVELSCDEAKLCGREYQHLEYYVDQDEYRLVPVGLVDSAANSDDTLEVVMDFDMHFETQGKPVVELLSSNESEKESNVSVLEPKDLIENEQSEDVTTSTSVEAATLLASCDEVDSRSNADIVRGEIDDSCVHQATTEDDSIYVPKDENDVEVSIGTVIPDHDPYKEVIQLANELLNFYSNVQEDPSISSPIFSHADSNSNYGSKKEDDDCLEASMHGSAASDIEYGEGVLTMEKMKSLLRAEREASNKVYVELEEERNASAIAASQTMAMINKLQEEKAAMHMEALQYQRMMDEQSEYDQEAMQLLNELMVKRVKEKQELEMELALCRKKIQDYDNKEKMRILKRMTEGCTISRTSSDPCSNTEDSDGLSIVLSREVKEEDNLSGHEESRSRNTLRDAVLCIEESLSSFEEEKLYILDRLKELEEKLLALNDEEENEHYEDQFFSDNGDGYHENDDLSSEENVNENGQSNEMKGTNDQDGKSMGSIIAKRLLPLFNEAEDENSEGYDSVVSQDQKTFAVEDELDQVYERLQALEADREFLKHCLSSLRKGDKGLDLLQEILQHLRDLRSVETRLRNSGDGVL